MFRRRFSKSVVALALATGVLAPTAAGLSAAVQSSVASALPVFYCHKFYGHLYSSVAIAKCGVPQRGAHFAGSNLLSGGTLIWSKAPATTTYTGTSTSPGQGVCGTGRVEYDFTGTITADTSGYTVVGDPVSYDICIVSTTHVVKLVLGTTGSF